MKYIDLKDTDLHLSNVCYGTGNFGDGVDKETAFLLLDEFVRQGGNFIDTANCYCRWVPGNANSAEQFLGEWLKSRGAYKNVVIATKGAHYDLDNPAVSRVNEACIRKDAEESMKTMGLDVLDFYWLHRDDESRPLEEIIDILEDLKKEGKIRYYGLSNYRKARLARAKEYLTSKGLNGPYAVSNQWSLAEVNAGKNVNQDPSLVITDEELYAWYQETRTPVVPFSSTALGFFEKLKKAGVKAENGQVISVENPQILPEKIKAAYWNEKNLKVYEKLLEIQKETGHSLHALSAAWLFTHQFQAFCLGSARNTTQLRGLCEASEIALKL